ncbi:MAG TPA: hypothetical protein VLA34_10670, partial [Candidatus Krumholzibacterium sp.]|nr:hypothetical protein [Candidatus Krumholzibacterium sp.]
FKYRPWVSTCETDYGTILYATPPNAFQIKTPHRVKWLGRSLGKDNYEIYRRWLGMGPTRVDDLKEKGVI